MSIYRHVLPPVQHPAQAQGRSVFSGVVGRPFARLVQKRRALYKYGTPPRQTTTTIGGEGEEAGKKRKRERNEAAGDRETLVARNGAYKGAKRREATL